MAARKGTAIVLTARNENARRSHRRRRLGRKIRAEPDDPVMAVVRVTAPAGVDPYVLQAELTRAVCAGPMTAELTLLPSWRQPKNGVRQHGFVAILRASTGKNAVKLARAAEKASRKALRGKFGSAATVQVRPVRATEEITAFWYSARGTPRRH